MSECDESSNEYIYRYIPVDDGVVSDEVEELEKKEGEEEEEEEGGGGIVEESNQSFFFWAIIIWHFFDEEIKMALLAPKWDLQIKAIPLLTQVNASDQKKIKVVPFFRRIHKS